MEGKQRIPDALQSHAVSRRDFLRFCTAMSAALALPAESEQLIVHALESADRLPVIWLHAQECTGDSESLLRSGDPDITDILLDVVSLEYHDTVMVDSGLHAEEKMHAAMERYGGGYVLVVEGSIPTGENAHYCIVGGRTMEQILLEAAEGAAAIVCVGACAAWGGWPSSRPNPTGAKGVSSIVQGKPIINLTGCPHNGQVFAATIVHYLTFGRLPDTDSVGRPLFAHGKRIHDNCERRAHFDAGQFVEHWGDEGHRLGWCLYKMGCKGPQAYYNCPTIRWNDGTSWPVMAGHGCIACASVNFWDDMTPFYKRLPDVNVIGVEDTIDRLGVGAMALTLGAIALHAVGTSFWKRRRSVSEAAASDSHQAADMLPPAYPNDVNAVPPVQSEPDAGNTAFSDVVDEEGPSQTAADDSPRGEQES
ncbi:MAG: hydrogenase small subunit [Anaerolineae bacterium]|nr:hydrogenase small subunit [Anaerolineae bacterium]